MSHLRIMTIAGARPNFMKVASISEAIERHNGSQADPLIEHVLVHTGQHYDEKLSQCFFDELGLPRPDINLDVGSASHSVQTANIMKGFEPVLLDIRPDILIVVGDVNSTVACALVASKSRFPHGSRFGMLRPLIVHVEAGLRSRDRSMPEEINRILTDALSDVLFVTEEAAIENLQHEGISRGRIHFVGNVMIDTLRRHLEAARRRSVRERLGIDGHYGLVTLHRPSNVDSKESLLPLLECLMEISEDLPLFFPLHPRTRVTMQRLGLWDLAESARYLTILEPLTYLDFLNLLETAGLVLTDSGGIQEETTALGVPCVTLRENTERPVTTTLGTNYLVGTDPEKILTTAKDILAGRGKTGQIPPYWDGLAGERIIATLTNTAHAQD
jgi:UDP-N-acetylglucosamine 2-epimerase (non-hydrolysing)